MDMHERLKEARTSAGFESARSAAEALSIPPSTYASHENGSRGVKLDEIISYARRFRVDPTWLAFGKKNGDAEVSPVRVDTVGAAPNGQALVPVYDVSASAGFGELVDYEEQTHSLAFPPDYLKRLTSSPPRNLAIISVKGESMEPTLVDDDIVLVDMSKTHMGFEGLFVLRHNDTLLVKRAGMAAKNGHVMLISDNKAYPPVEAALADLNVIGKVLWYGRKV